MQRSAPNIVMNKNSQMRTFARAGWIVFTALAAFGQPAAPSFEVASVKPAAPKGEGIRIQMGADNGRINYSFVTLKNILARAYSLTEPQIVGPEWLGSDRYNIVAKIPDGVSKDKIPVMLQTLVTERFKLEAHRETKALPVYALVAGKGGSKLKDATGDTGLRFMMGPKGRKLSGNGSMTELTDALSRFLDRPVIDQTGLKGTYDIDLEWTPDDNMMGPMRGMPQGGP